MERKSLKDEFRDFMSETIDKVSKNIFLDDLSKIRDDISQSSQTIEEKIKEINLSNDLISEVSKKEEALSDSMEKLYKLLDETQEKSGEIHEKILTNGISIKAETEEIKEFGSRIIESEGNFRKELLEETKKLSELITKQAGDNAAVVEEIKRQKSNIGWMSVIIFATVVLMGIIPSDGVILIAVKCVIAAIMAVFAKKVWK
ncbi:hypothetical protein SAMN06296386_11436 [Lachnospiraceae bacterium]|nr:hypothetical protein SAMN06296386_11436 [Lachnospiraceae bacterium]